MVSCRMYLALKISNLHSCVFLPAFFYRKAKKNAVKYQTFGTLNIGAVDFVVEKSQFFRRRDFGAIFVPPGKCPEFLLLGKCNLSILGLYQ